VKRIAKEFLVEEEGLTTVEYALLLALIIVATLTAWTTCGATMNRTLWTIPPRVFGE